MSRCETAGCRGNTPCGACQLILTTLLSEAVSATFVQADIERCHSIARKIGTYMREQLRKLSQER